MKKKIWKIIPLLLTASISAPLALNVTSCASHSNLTSNLKVYDDRLTKETTYQELSSANVTLKQILYGSTSLYNGNYIFFIGSAYSKEQPIEVPSLRWAINGSAAMSYDLGLRNVGNSKLAGLYGHIKREVFGNEENKFGIFTFIDGILDGSRDKTRAADFSDPNDVWTEDDEKQKDEQKTDAVKGQYKRYDASAKTARYLTSYLPKLFPEKATWPTVCMGPNFIVWKEGKPVHFATKADDRNIEAFYKEIADLYTKSDKDDK